MQPIVLRLQSAIVAVLCTRDMAIFQFGRQELIAALNVLEAGGLEWRAYSHSTADIGSCTLPGLPFF
jgi:hypothetical protein